MVLSIVLSSNSESAGINCALDLVDPRPRVFILQSSNKWACDFHFLSPAAEAKPFLLVDIKVRLKVINIRGRRFGHTK